MKFCLSTSSTEDDLDLPHKRVQRNPFKNIPTSPTLKVIEGILDKNPSFPNKNSLGFKCIVSTTD